MSIFSQTPVRSWPSSQFDLSHDHKTVVAAGKLIPIAWQEMLPGSVINMRQIVQARLLPMLAPIYHKIDITITHHFVPVRLLWEQSYEKFFADIIPNDETPVAPYLTDLQVSEGDLADYMGLPTQFVGSGANRYQQYDKIDKVLALPFAVYQKCCSDWYRDENLDNAGNEYFYKLTDGSNNSNSVELLTLRNRAWQHDYFTSALPWAQKGDAVEIPIGNFADLPVNWNNPTAGFGEINLDGGSIYPNTATIKTNQAVGDMDGNTLFVPTSDLSQSAAVTVNTLRWATRIQEFLEANARGGTRYIELTRHRFGVKSSDLRAQRSEYLGWSKQPIVMSEVLTTANTEDGATGDLYGHGISVGHSRNAHYRAEENGYYIAILSIRPKTSYYQGIHRSWSRFTNLDWAYPQFAQLGEQEILNREVYYSDTDGGNNDGTFGYTPRYSEYKYMDDRVSAEMRGSLDFWHMGRTFANRPVLSPEFIACNPTTRVFSVTTGRHYVLYITNQCKMWHVLPKFGIPSL